MAKLEGKKILLIEDDDLLSQMLSKKIVESGASIDRAKDGEEGLAMLSANKYDLLLLDLLLPKIDGFSVLQKKNENPAVKDVPVIILSNLGQKADVEKGIAFGAKRFLVKAILSLDEVVDASMEVLG